MARKHGWQLPAHKYQVVAITVFCLLVITFYAFLAPFLGGHIWEYTLIGIYSPVVVTVFVLYVRCTAINPADPGIMTKFDPEVAKGAGKNHGLLAKKENRDETASAAPSLSSASRHSLGGAESSKKGSLEELGRVNSDLQPIRGRHKCGICGMFVHEDCRKQDPAAEQHGSADDALYCTLCNAKVRKFSKHCRSCDKCVDGFDHHCVWLNNCIGHKNYYTFIYLMAVSLIWLALEAGVGIVVFVRCFADKKSMNSKIVGTLGNGFSRAPFATIVAISTVVSILACVRLGELFFFHMILIRKGLTTYEYMVAMRTMSEAPAGASMDEELPNVLYSPLGSATTGFSGGSSLGLPYKGTWCTPPRIFVDYQDEVVPRLVRGMVPNATGDAERGNMALKKPVKLSAWKLAKLDSTEALRAAEKARASSSVLKPVDNCRLGDPEYSSSSNTSARSSASTDTGTNKEATNDGKLAMFATSQGSRDEYDTGTQSVSSVSSPSHIHESVTLIPLPQNHNLPKFDAATSVPGFPLNLPVASRAPPRSGDNKEATNDGKLAMFATSQGSRDEYDTGTQSVSSVSSPSHIHESVTLSPLPQNHSLPKFGAATSVPGFPVNLPVASRAPPCSGDNKDDTNDGKLAMFTTSQGSRDEYDTGTQSVSSVSSPSHIHESVTLSPLPQNHSLPKFGAATSVPGFPVNLPVASRAPPRSGDNIVQKVSTVDPLLLSAPATSLLRDIKRTSVVWDEEAGRYVSVPVSASEAQKKSTFQSELAKLGTETSNLGLKREATPHEPPLQQADKPMNSGDSIFFGGLPFNLTLRNDQGNERGSASRKGQHRLALNLPRVSRFKRDATSNQLPVFAPGGSDPSSGSGAK